MSIIAAHMITHQCVTLDYCTEATVRSMMDLCDIMYINDGQSSDGTLDILYTLQGEYGKDRIVIFEREWVHDRQVWANEKNFLLDKIPKDAYVLCVDADEVFHEDDMPFIYEAVAAGYPAIAFGVIHFYGTPAYFIDGPSWYKQHTRLWAQHTKIRLYHRDHGCADDVLWPDGFPAHLGNFFYNRAKIYHYGNCRDPKAIGMKAKKADDLYQYSTEYKNGALAKPRAFTYALETSGAKLFTGTHPKYIKSWYDSHVNQATSYMIEGQNENKLWCFN